MSEPAPPTVCTYNGDQVPVTEVLPEAVATPIQRSLLNAHRWGRHHDGYALYCLACTHQRAVDAYWRDLEQQIAAAAHGETQ